MKKKIISTLSIAILILGVVAFLFRGQLVRLYYFALLPNLTINTPDLGRIEDGRYKGEYDGHLVSVELTTVIKDHQIVEIILDEHDHQRGVSAEVIPDKIIEAQSLDVDAITGATQSSNVIRKAVENALTID